VDFDKLFDKRHHEADTYYEALQRQGQQEWKTVQRQALAGMLWSKEFYHYDVAHWRRATRPNRRSR